MKPRRCGALAAAAQHLQRRRRTVTRSEAGATRRRRWPRLVNFCGNDYLGLNAIRRSSRRWRECAAARGAGSGASHLVSGHGLEHEGSGSGLAQFTGRPRALLFSTGYMANLAAVTASPARESW